MRKLALALALFATVSLGCNPPAAADVTAADRAGAHEAHGHDQYRRGSGTPGHTWAAYGREARQINRYARAVALNRLATCSRDPHCAVRLASFLTGAPHGLVARVVGCESGWDPSAANPSSSAGGLLQFLETTWNSLAPQWGVGDRSRFEVWPAALVGAGTIAQGGIAHWNASRHCWS
jgi:hypothetical protein